MWPRRGASIYLLFVDPAYEPHWDAFGQIHREAGIIDGLTRVFLLDAWARDHNGRLPCRQRPDGKYDLFDWNAEYFAALTRFVETMNAHGIVPMLCYLDIYAWADRGQRGDVPDANQGPWRHNVNGVRWGDPDDRTFGAPENPDMLPDRWMKDFIGRVCTAVSGLVVIHETANEMPEKPMHWRIAREIRKHDGVNRISCNRQEDTPGQIFNMKIGEDIDLIAFHNWGAPAVLDVVHPDEAAAGRPTTFRELIEHRLSADDVKQIILSTDGCRPFTSSSMLELMRWCWRRGIAIEWQSEAKMAYFRDGAADYGDVRRYVEKAFLAQLGAL